MKNIVSIFVSSLWLIMGISNAQDITNTLAPDGSFLIKDGSADYLSLPQTTGFLSLNRSLVLPNTTNSGLGVIFKGVDRFLHNYGIGSTFLGINAGNFAISGYDNTAVGTAALLYTTTGSLNCAFGNSALANNLTGNDNSAFGTYALFNNLNGVSNSAYGSYSLYTNSTGSYNSAFGNGALDINTTGNRNSAFSYVALTNNTTGSYNSAFGNGALNTNSNGWYNSAFGFQALFSVNGSANTALGYLAGSDILTGGNNTVIGYLAQVPNNNGDNQIRMGDSFISYAGIQVAWTVTSDRRWKENIQPTNLGLGFITKLNPVSYSRKNDKNHKTEYGLIAQEIESVLKDEGIENTGMLTITDDGYYELRYNDLLSPMIKAIQELKSENDQLREEMKNLSSLEEQLAEIRELKSELVIQIKLLKANKSADTVKFSSVENQGE